MSADADVIVIGGGLFGCATAYYLAAFGLDTLVLEREGGLGADASGATAGNLHLQLSPSTYAQKDEAWIRSFSDTIPFFRDCVAFWREVVPTLPRDVELRITGGLMVAQTAAQLETLQRKTAIETAQGLDIALLSRAEVATLAPYLARDVLGAAWCPGEGMANPMLSVAAFADGARRAGARFRTGANVRAMTRDGSHWELDSSAGLLRAPRVVVAAGHGSAALTDALGLSLGLTSRVIQMAASEPCAPFVPHLVYHAEQRMTLKQTANGNVLMGGGWSASLDGRFGRPAALRESIEGALGVAVAVVPSLAPVNLLRTWAGYNVYTPDGRPYLGAVPGRDGLFLAICNTYGFTLGPLCALLAAEAVAGRKPSHDLAAFAPGRASARQ